MTIISLLSCNEKMSYVSRIKEIMQTKGAAIEDILTRRNLQLPP